MKRSLKSGVGPRLARGTSGAIIGLIPLLLAAAAPPALEPAFRAAAPPGWIVENGRDGRMEWLRFSLDREVEGEDYARMAVTLYRVEVDRSPEEAGQALMRSKLDAQAVKSKTAIDREVGGVRWRGFEARYTAEGGALRREIYLYAVRPGKTIFLLWVRGPESDLASREVVVEDTLRKVSGILEGKASGEGGKER